MMPATTQLQSRQSASFFMLPHACHVVCMCLEIVKKTYFISPLTVGQKKLCQTRCNKTLFTHYSQQCNLQLVQRKFNWCFRSVKLKVVNVALTHSPQAGKRSGLTSSILSGSIPADVFHFFRPQTSTWGHLWDFKRFDTSFSLTVRRPSSAP